MKIDGELISDHVAPYIIAEASCNHGGSLENAMALIKAAKESGANAIKFQAYTAESLTLNCDKRDFIIQEGLWRGRKLHELYSEAETPFEWFPQLMSRARSLGITMFASVFDLEGLEMLESIGCPAYKIASMEIVDIPLIRAVAARGKPMILSTGMATLNEVNEALYVCMRVPHALLHCVSDYPTSVYESNLSRMRVLRTLCKPNPCGISDHSVGWEVPVAATVMGASIIEKHLCLSHNMDTEDEKFSLDPDEFAKMTATVRSIWLAMGKPGDIPSPSEQLRRSLYVVKDMKKGDKFTHENVRSIRPGYGLPPKMLPSIIGKTAKCDLERGTALAKEFIG